MNLDKQAVRRVSMSISAKCVGATKEGKEIFTYTMKNKRGMEVEVLNIGGAIRRILVPNSDGDITDVVLGYEEATSYIENPPSFGAVVGRNANRIKGATVELDGKIYQLEKNDGENNLHGGGLGFAREFYEVNVEELENRDVLYLSRVSPDMEQGFPGDLSLIMTYTLTDDNELILRYQATTNKETVVNLTNHSYFNLSGHNSGSILEEELQVFTDRITATEESNIPVGGYEIITGTPMDFETPKSVGTHLFSDYHLICRCNGYDHNYVLGGDLTTIRKVAILTDKKAKRTMEVYTNKPGLQVYTTNFLTNDSSRPNKEYANYQPFDAICLETQYYPNACNVKEYPTSILKPEDQYDFTTIYKFL